MKSMLIIFTFVLVSCSSTISQSERHCSRVTNFGKNEICLPKIEGYQECYLNPVVKPLADATEIEINMVLGYYLNNQIHSKRDSLSLIRFDDYFKIYGTKQIQDFKADRKVLLETKTAMEGNFIKANWDSVEKEVDKLGTGLKVGDPVVLNTYSLSDDTFSIVMLIKYEMPGTDAFTMAMTVNGLLINQRLVWMAYYLQYQGEDTIDRLESNSNELVEKILAANN